MEIVILKEAEKLKKTEKSFYNLAAFVLQQQENKKLKVFRCI